MSTAAIHYWYLFRQIKQTWSMQNSERRCWHYLAQQPLAFEGLGLTIRLSGRLRVGCSRLVGIAAAAA